MRATGYSLRSHLFATIVAGLLSAVLSPATTAQGLNSVLEARGRVFPAVGPGIAALKRDSSGRYYVLAKPATEIAVYDAEGNEIGKIPNANSQSATIVYAVDFDLSPDGLLFVADRGANAVEIFKLDGSLAAKVPVSAPTSIVALSGGEFAVTSLTSKRLVQIRDERGVLLRSFGDPADSGEDAASKPLTDFGRISGDSNGDIYFAFASLPDPTLRRYDRFGYVAYETAVSESALSSGPTRGEDRVEVRLNLTHVSLSEQTAGSITLGSSRTVKFSGGVGTGVLGGMRFGGGSRGSPAQAAAMESGISGLPGNGVGGPMAGTVSGEISDQGPQFQFGLGRMPGLGGRGGGRRGSGSLDSSSDSSSQTSQGSQSALLQFEGSGSSSGIDFTQDDLEQHLSFNGQSSDGGLLADSGSEAAISGDIGTSNFSQSFGLPTDFLVGSLWNDATFRPQGFGGAFHGGFPGEHEHSGGTEGFRPEGEHFGPRGHFGGDVGLSASLRVNLGDLGANPGEKPTITAVGVDPQTQEVWAGMADMLVHFDKTGNPIEIYHLTMKGGAVMRPTAVLVEPNRLLIAANPWGIFEFARPGAQ